MKKLTAILIMAGISFILACGPSAEEISSKEKAIADSVASATSQPPADEGYTAEESVPQSEPGAAKSKSGKSTDDEDANANKNEETVTDKVTKRPPEQRNFYDSAYVAINSNRKLIKTANLVFSVKDVEKATLRIEQLAYLHGGFTLNSGITKNVIQANTIRINNDSVMEVGICKIENNITLRVPQFLLDSLLLKLSALWIELDERTVKAEDVTIDYLSNELRAKIHQKTAVNISRVAQNQSNRLDDVVEAERVANTFLDASIDKQIKNMTLQDRVDYATVTLNLYQDEVMYKKTFASYELEEYEPGFGSEMVDSLSFGWQIILNFILFLAKGWSVILISVGIFLVIYYFIKWLIRRKRNKTPKAA